MRNKPKIREGGENYENNDHDHDDRGNDWGDKEVGPDLDHVYEEIDNMFPIQHHRCENVENDCVGDDMVDEQQVNRANNNIAGVQPGLVQGNLPEPGTDGAVVAGQVPVIQYHIRKGPQGQREETSVMYHPVANSRPGAAPRGKVGVTEYSVVQQLRAGFSNAVASRQGRPPQLPPRRPQILQASSVEAEVHHPQEAAPKGQVGLTQYHTVQSPGGVTETSVEIHPVANQMKEGRPKGVTGVTHYHQVQSPGGAPAETSVEIHPVANQMKEGRPKGVTGVTHYHQVQSPGGATAETSVEIHPVPDQTQDAVPEGGVVVTEYQSVQQLRNRFEQQ